MSRFAGDLSGALAGADPGANLVFSPASVALALAMVGEGAAGTTAAQIDALLPHNDRAELTRAVRALTSAADLHLTLAIVNAMFVQRGYRLGQHFVDTLQSTYETTPQLTDYAADPERARRGINAWVDEITRHRIGALLPAGAIDVDTRLTLVNAIYMKARWQFPFLSLIHI